MINTCAVANKDELTRSEGSTGELLLRVLALLVIKHEKHGISPLIQAHQVPHISQDLGNKALGNKENPKHVSTWACACAVFVQEAISSPGVSAQGCSCCLDAAGSTKENIR